MELYIIRHGQSTNNALRSAVGRVQDAPLTEIGHRQAEALAQHLAAGPYPESEWERRAGYEFDHLYCSAMQRALQTAEPVGKALGLKPEVWVEVHEQGGIYLDSDDGRYIGFPGMTRAEISERFPDYVLPESVTESGWWNNKTYEDVGAAAGRAIAVAEILIERSQQGDERIALISHGMFVNLLIKALLNQLPSATTYYHHYNTGISRIDINPHAPLILRYLNRTAHLTPDLLTH
ncbi:MAG TPA: histidine phosphatase family protein [Spirillospora sp.]|jgi:broad specificity phosphatase PhoE|nr:histidine phosphatase family protein [Spirillospora sp.]